MKQLILVLMLITLSLDLFSQEKHFERNQLPQLDQQILDSSDFKYKKIRISTESIIPQPVIHAGCCQKKTPPAGSQSTMIKILNAIFPQLKLRILCKD